MGEAEGLAVGGDREASPVASVMGVRGQRVAAAAPARAAVGARATDGPAG